MRTSRLTLGLATVAGIVLLAGLATSCGPQNEPDPVKESVDFRWENYRRAVALLPPPQQVNFPLREALIKFTQREDQKNHPWWIYIQGFDGTLIGDYYIAQTPPLNECLFLGPTEDVDYDSDGGNTTLTAPSLDGMFYGGSGSSGACKAYFFFDYTTDGMVMTSQQFTVSDVPLKLDIPVRRIIPQSPDEPIVIPSE